MRIYLVGGALRDRLLDLPVKDRDWVVVGATEQAMLDLGYRRADSEFPVFLHPETGEEYALARRETKTGLGYKGFDVYAGPDVTLEQDLQRRDLTINAMAEDETGGIVDPFNGRVDLDDGIFRHVSPAFVEDPVRVLRVARFAAKLGQWGFKVAHGTHALMKKMADSEDMAALRRQRIWQEMQRALVENQPWRFFQVLHRCGALSSLLPGMAALFAEPQGHADTRLPDPMEALERITQTTTDARARFVVACFRAAENTGDSTLDLPVEKGYRELMELTLNLGPLFHSQLIADAAQTLEFLEKGRALQQPERFALLLLICSALWPEQAEQACDLFRSASDVISGISAESLQADGLAGAELGRALREQRLQAIARLFS